MDDEQRRAVARVMSERREEDGVYLYRQGEAAAAMYVIVEGKVEIVKENNGREQVIGIAGCSDVVGEMEVLVDMPRAASLRTQGDVHLLTLEAGVFHTLTHQHPDMLKRVIQLLVSKLTAVGVQ